MLTKLQAAEIGEIDQATQVKLLRFLGERTFERVGSNKTLAADVRLIAATNKNLSALVKQGQFREDLFFRLRVFEIQLPPLRHRSDDVPLLAQAFLKEFARENAKAVRAIAPDAMAALLGYPWPGNVRELRTAMEHAVVLARTDAIMLRDLPANVRSGNATDTLVLGELESQKPQTVKDAERQMIIDALAACNGNRSAAAKRLGLSRRTLYRKLDAYGLEALP